jgi:cystathionine beta-lyase family protein involved in aluminum resistance
MVLWDRIGAVKRDRIYNTNYDAETAKIQAATVGGTHVWAVEVGGGGDENRGVTGIGNDRNRLW